MFINNNVGKKGDDKIKAFLEIFKDNKGITIGKNCTYFQAQHKDCSRI